MQEVNQLPHSRRREYYESGSVYWIKGRLDGEKSTEKKQADHLVEIVIAGRAQVSDDRHIRRGKTS